MQGPHGRGKGLNASDERFESNLWLFFRAGLRVQYRVLHLHVLMADTMKGMYGLGNNVFPSSAEDVTNTINSFTFFKLSVG